VPSGGEQRIAKPLLRVGLQQGTGNHSDSSPYRNCPPLARPLVSISVGKVVV
jgi:hypothetical protein